MNIFRATLVTVLLASQVVYTAGHATDRAGDLDGHGEDVDSIITNNKMRAESGSKSKYSVSIGAGYSGGSLQKPLDARRPNISQGTGNTDFASLGGGVSGKYNFSAKHSVFAGIGVRWLTPLQAGVPEGYDGQKVDVDNPSVTYQYLYRWYGIESAVQAQAVYYTNVNLVREGYVVTGAVSQNNVYLIPHTSLSVGLLTYVGSGYFNNNTLAAKADQSDYSFGLQPFLEYQLTEKLMIGSSSNLAVFQHIRSSRDANTYRRQDVTQSLGLGYAVTRDFFVSPSVDFLIGDIRADRAVASVNLTINLF